MDSSFAVSAGEALVASIGEMTQSSTNKLIDISRKVTLARLLDDTTSNTNTNANANNENTDGKENGTLTINAAGQNAVLSERSNNTSSSSGGSNIGRTTARTNHGAVEALRDLRDLSTIVSEIERRAATLRDAIDTHRRDNEARREMSETTRQQTAQLAATLLALPEHLPHAAPQPASSAATATSSADRTAPSAESGPVARSRGNPAAAGAEAGRVATSDLPEVPVLELVTVGELEGVPRSTRARLTIEQVNAAVAEIQKAVERRHAFMSKPRKKMSEKQRNRLEELLQQEVPGHGGEPFIAEPDLRALPAFKKGEMTAKALIATLRNLKRLKGVRGAGMMTYVVQGG